MNELTTQPAVGMTGVDPAASLLQILQKIQQLQGQPVVPDNPLAQIGTALSGMAAGVQGRPNPVLGQFTQQRQMDLSTLQQQAGIAGTMATIQHQKTQEDAQKRQEERQREGALDAMVAKLITADNPSVRLYGGQIMKKQLKDRGIEVPDDVVVGLATGKMDMTKLKEVALMKAGGYPLDVIASSTGIPPDVIMQSESLLQSDDSRKLLGLPTLSEQRLAVIKEEKETLDIVQTKAKLNDPLVAKEVLTFAVQMTKKHPRNITDAEMSAAADKWIAHDLARAQLNAGAQAVPSETSRLLVNSEASAAAVDSALAILADPKKYAVVKDYIGPMLTGAPLKEGLQRNLPSEWVGDVPPELTDLGVAEAAYQNMLLAARSGQAVTEGEYQRNMKEAPNRAKDKPEVYARKWAHAKKVAQSIMQRQQKLAAVGGRASVDQIAPILRQTPLPGPLAQGAGPGEVYVKHKTTGQVGIAKQGEKLSPEWEPIP